MHSVMVIRGMLDIEHLGQPRPELGTGVVVQGGVLITQYKWITQNMALAWMQHRCSQHNGKGCSSLTTFTETLFDARLGKYGAARHRVDHRQMTGMETGRVTTASDAAAAAWTLGCACAARLASASVP